ncbi:Holliday junction branch migration protein RuvA [Bacillus alkalicellulosilyticus]|uniref:Holliday junction branch migration protein RuvA n=1 Tax=Alkalihalobacterium alkalicellulosilyticum TaxID=1912214 RepID=UPI000997115A|nr:Holliday junction branch migration protein RuvA [Bacillus alkalicellulosilyticus]
MIESIQGKLECIDPYYIVVETGGIGYQVFCPNPFAFEKYRNTTIKVYTHQYVREDILRLFGFSSREERKMFEKLLNVSGIGPKGALAILATGEPSQLVEAIEGEKEEFLTKFPGVGKKTARQMILDLKGKLEDFVPNQLSLQPDYTKADAHELSEALEALRALGYVEREIKKVEKELKKEELSTDQYIKKALQLMLSL